MLPPPEIVAPLPLTHWFINECTSNRILNQIEVRHLSPPRSNRYNMLRLYLHLVLKTWRQRPIVQSLHHNIASSSVGQWTDGSSQCLPYQCPFLIPQTGVGCCLPHCVQRPEWGMRDCMHLSALNECQFEHSYHWLTIKQNQYRWGAPNKWATRISRDISYMSTTFFPYPLQ